MVGWEGDVFALVALVGCERAATEGDTRTAVADPTLDPQSVGELLDLPLVGHSGFVSLGHSAEVATGDTGSSFTVDCSAVPARPLSVRTVEGARAYHDLALSPDGRLIGLSTTLMDLLAAPYLQPAAVLVPSFWPAQGMDWLPDGDLAVVRDRDRTLTRVDVHSGATSVLASGVEAYGLVTGPDGDLWYADHDRIVRVDPASGDQTVLLDPVGVFPRVLDFSPDHRRLYVGTQGGDGTVYAAALNEAGDPISDLVPFARGVGNGQYHDLLRVDWCGNVYVSDYATQTMYRIGPEGDTEVYLDMRQGWNYAHGARFGNGAGGYRRDALYVAQPYRGNLVGEIVVGVPGRDWDGEPF